MFRSDTATERKPERRPRLVELQSQFLHDARHFERTRSACSAIRHRYAFQIQIRQQQIAVQSDKQGVGRAALGDNYTTDEFDLEGVCHAASGLKVPK